jgi:transcriptional regulator with XRE-family HTH domain
MTRTSSRAISQYARDAIILLGQVIRERRIAAKITTTELAQRAGISRASLQRIEKGDPGSGIGAYFESAAIVGVPLFEEDRHVLAMRVSKGKEKLALLPQSIRHPAKAVKDDF